MYLCYFDEVKADFVQNKESFFIGGLALEDKIAHQIEKELSILSDNFFGSAILNKETELHGTHIMYAKGAFKGRGIEERINLFRALIQILDRKEIHKFSSRIDVKKLKQQQIVHTPEYNLGLMLHTKNIDKFLLNKKQLGILFGDFERDYTDNSITNFSELRASQNLLGYERNITNLVDTIYFGHSHHSRLIQLADIFMYLVQLRYYNSRTKYMQTQVLEFVDNSAFMRDIIKEDYEKNEATSP